MSNPNGTTTDPRDLRAAALLAAGAVTLHFDGSASVRGSGKAVYTIRRDADGVTHCDCPDHTRRAAQCKHLRATAALCKLYRAFREQARETGRTRLPFLLAKALPKGGVTPPAVETLARKRVILTDDQSDLFPVYSLGKVAA